MPEITNVDIREFTKGGQTKAFVTVTLDNCFVLKEITIKDSLNGFWVALPSKKGKDDKYYDTFHPITKEYREYFNKTILDKWEGFGG